MIEKSTASVSARSSELHETPHRHHVVHLHLVDHAGVVLVIDLECPPNNVDKKILLQEIDIYFLYLLTLASGLLFWLRAVGEPGETP